MTDLRTLDSRASVTRTSRTIRLLAIVWLVIVAALVAHNLWLWSGSHLKLETDVLAMLPQDEREPAVNQATRHLTEAASRRIVVLVGGHDEAAALRAGDAYEASIKSSVERDAKAAIGLRYRVSESTLDEWLDFFTPYRRSLLTREQRQMLAAQTPQALTDRAIEALYRPLGMPRVGAWQDDPLNLFSDWLTAHANESRVRVSQGRLVLNHEDQHYAVLMLEQQAQGFSFTSQQNLLPVLDRAKAVAMNLAATEVLTIGVPLYTAAAANQAEREIHTIGLGSMAGIILLTLLAFSAIRPRILVTLSIGIGLLAAISVCALLFERIYLLTMVFGASLVGVAENYGTNYFTSRLGRPPEERWIMLREQAPVMALALLTTVIGYVALALTPFPGLRQMAVFSVVGLVAAFVTVLLWFPFLDAGKMDYTRLSRWIGSGRACWPALSFKEGNKRFTLIFSLVVIAILLSGAQRFQTNDDIRLLQNAPPDLVAQQLQINRLLDLPGVAQFYLVRGADVETVLQREEILKTKLDVLIDESVLSGYQAVSDWVPSHAQQTADALLVSQKVDGEQGVLARVARQLGESAPTNKKEFSPKLNVDDWLAAPVSEPLRAQWLGRLEQGDHASVILLRGVDTPVKLTRLASLADTVSGVRWVDKVAEVSALMARYRVLMGIAIAISYLLVFVALWLRYRRHAWRALLPTLLASMLALALLALLGQPLQLFNVLALLLILGMGVDYGIFLLQQPEREAQRPFLSVTLAAACTLLSFGLLALSMTPALRAFGLTMLFGIGLAWLLTPLFMPSSSSIRK